MAQMTIPQLSQAGGKKKRVKTKTQHTTKTGQ